MSVANTWEDAGIGDRLPFLGAGPRAQFVAIDRATQIIGDAGHIGLPVQVNTTVGRNNVGQLARIAALLASVLPRLLGYGTLAVMSGSMGREAPNPPRIFPIVTVLKPPRRRCLNVVLAWAPSS